MQNFTIFVPRAGGTAKENLTAFILSTKSILKAYKNVGSWDENAWDLGGNVAWRGRGQGRISAVFSSHEASGGQDEVAMSQPFLDFAKAYFLYFQALRPSKAFFQRLAALRVLEQALRSGSKTPDVINATPAIFNVADDLIKKRFGAGAGYRVGRELTAIADAISEYRMVSVPFQWESGRGRPKDGNRTGPEADAKRKEKLPSQAALDALPRCFLLAEDVIDIIVSSVAALLCVAPSRISEVFSLPVDCEVEQERNGKTDYGLRWWPGKGADPMVKWIAPTMVDIARAAVLKLRTVSQPARTIAEWYEANPGRIYLKPGLEHLRSNSLITFSDVDSILGFGNESYMRAWIKANKIPISSGNNGIDYVEFADLEIVILRMLPSSFPVIDPKTQMLYSKSLILVRKNEVHKDRATYDCMVEPVGTTKINDGLGSGMKNGKGSMFARLGFTEPDQGPIEVHSHQFRHWLNTLAQQGGLSQLDIAKWSGRKDIQQNKAYDHMTGLELIEMTRALTLDDPRMAGSMAELAANAPVSRDEFMQLEFPTAHVTEIGFCIHDYTMLPCQKHGECINCNEHVCVKGDGTKLARLKEQLKMAEEQLATAAIAIEEGRYGSERWHEHHLKTVDRLRELVRVHEDSSFPIGTIIRLFNPNEFSPLLAAIHDRIEYLASENNTEIQGIVPWLLGGQ